MLWQIESSRGNKKHPPVSHLATVGTTEPLCTVKLAKGHVWRTPPKQLRAERECKNCADLAERMGLR
jgi:hypothetical protein